MQPPAGPHQVFSSVYNRQFAKGLVRHPQKDHLQQLSARRHQAVLQALAAEGPPGSWDSCSKGWVGPIKNQASCGSCWCHDDKTEVLTEKGWIKWPDYDGLTALATMNLGDGMLEFQPCLKRHVYNYDGPLHYANHPSLDFAVTPDHGMYGIPRKSRHRAGIPFLFRYTASTLPRFCELPGTTKGWVGTELEKVGIAEKWHFSGDDFLALVALVLSDGGSYLKYKDGKVDGYNVTFCCFREERINMVRDLAARIGFKEQESRPGVWNIYDKPLATWFLKNCFEEGGHTAPLKRIPLLVKCASKRQIDHFLKFFGDQCIQGGTIRRFFTCSRGMAGDLQELLLRIGKRSSITESPPRSGGKAINGKPIIGKYPEFIINENTRSIVFGRESNLETDYYKGEVYCATVPNGTLITRRNGKLLISSNCFSGTGTVEIAYNVAGVGGGPDKLILSEQYTLDCGRNGGCGGDDNVTVLEWAKKTGLPLSADYGPYHASSNRCQFKQQQTLYKIDDWGFADSSQGQGVTPAELIKAAIMKYGCVGAAIAADGAFSNYQAGQVFDHTTSQSIDHDIILVGWDDSKGSKGAWKLRNSWGTSWGDGGYCYIGYGVNLVGTEAVWAYVNHQNPPIDWYC